MFFDKLPDSGRWDVPRAAREGLRRTQRKLQPIGFDVACIDAAAQNGPPYGSDSGGPPALVGICFERCISTSLNNPLPSARVLTPRGYVPEVDHDLALAPDARGELAGEPAVSSRSRPLDIAGRKPRTVHGQYADRDKYRRLASAARDARTNAAISDGGLSTNAASANLQRRAILDVDLSDTTKTLSARHWRRAQVPR
jgi:hypothetical protein